MGKEHGCNSVQPDLPATDNGGRHEVIVTGCVTKIGRGFISVIMSFSVVLIIISGSR